MPDNYFARYIPLLIQFCIAYVSWFAALARLPVLAVQNGDWGEHGNADQDRDTDPHADCHADRDWNAICPHDAVPSRGRRGEPSRRETRRPRWATDPRPSGPGYDRAPLQG